MVVLLDLGESSYMMDFLYYSVEYSVEYSRRNHKY